MILNILRWIAVLAIAFAAGKIMTKIKMPSILGWLIVGMLLGPILGISLLAAIINLGSPLDYHLILGAGLYTFIYIAARTIGTIAAATVINEFIAVFAAKKGFEMSKEIS